LAIEATMEPPVTVSRNQRSKIPDEQRGFYRVDGVAGRGTPDIDRREEKRIKRYRRDRTGSALAPMEVGIRAELGSAEMSMLVPVPASPARLSRPPTGVRSCRLTTLGNYSKLRPTFLPVIDIHRL
jgi:hypothetical protein